MHFPFGGPAKGRSTLAIASAPSGPFTCMLCSALGSRTECLSPWIRMP